MSEFDARTSHENGPSERKISRGVYVATLILFCFPLVTISCEQGGAVLETHSRSGLQMSLGGHTTTKGDNSRSTLTGERANPWMTVFAIAVFAGLMIPVVAPDRKDWSIAELISGSTALTALLFQFVLLDTYRAKLGDNSMGEYGKVTGRYTFWLMLTFVAVVGLVVLSVRRFLRHSRNGPPDDFEEPEAIPIVEPLPDDS